MSRITSPYEHIQCRGKTLQFGSRSLIMGVLNITPDSFSDGGAFFDIGVALERANQLIGEGADILDIGGESTRPGASYVDKEEEIRRIKPIFEALGKHATIPLSIDTRKASVAQVALDLGADIVNDVSALRDDVEMAKLVQQSGAGVVLIHRQGHSMTMQRAPHYQDVVQEVKDFLVERLTMAQSHGIASDQLMVDPGIGFGKTLEHNLKILGNLSTFVSLGYPLLVGVSRKAMIGELTGRPLREREIGNAAAIATAVWQGAHILRVHDVGAMKDAIHVAQALRDSCDK